MDEYSDPGSCCPGPRLGRTCAPLLRSVVKCRSWDHRRRRRAQRPRGSVDTECPCCWQSVGGVTKPPQAARRQRSQWMDNPLAEPPGVSLAHLAPTHPRYPGGDRSEDRRRT